MTFSHKASLHFQKNVPNVPTFRNILYWKYGRIITLKSVVFRNNIYIIFIISYNTFYKFQDYLYELV